MCSIELFDTRVKTNRLPSPAILMLTQPNGRCFWACLYLACGASSEERRQWRLKARNNQGFPLNLEHRKLEDETVKGWALKLNGGNIPESIKDGIMSSKTAEAEDLDTWQFFQTTVLDSSIVSDPLPTKAKSNFVSDPLPTKVKSEPAESTSPAKEILNYLGKAIKKEMREQSEPAESTSPAKETLNDIGKAIKKEMPEHVGNRTVLLPGSQGIVEDFGGDAARVAEVEEQIAKLREDKLACLEGVTMGDLKDMGKELGIKSKRKKGDMVAAIEPKTKEAAGTKTKLIVPKGFENPISQNITNVFSTSTWNALSSAEAKSKPKTRKKPSTWQEVPFFQQPAEKSALTLENAFQKAPASAGSRDIQEPWGWHGNHLS
eukprot:s3536_g9.t1